MNGREDESLYDPEYEECLRALDEAAEALLFEEMRATLWPQCDRCGLTLEEAGGTFVCGRCDELVLSVNDSALFLEV